MRRFLHRFQKIDIYRPYLPLSLISMTLMDTKKWWSRSSSNIWNHISTIHVLYLDFYIEFKTMMYNDLIWTYFISMTKVYIERQVVEEYIKFKHLKTFMCIANFIHRFLHRIQKNCKNWPHPYFWTWSTPPPYTSRCLRGSWSWYQFNYGDHFFKFLEKI